MVEKTQARGGAAAGTARPADPPRHGIARGFEEGGPADPRDPDIAGGGAGGAGGVTGGASGRTNAGTCTGR